jgi:hypothetical protein
MIRTLTVLLLLGTAHADSSVDKPNPTRDVLGVCEKYRQAMEARDVPALIALAHPKYHETAGTPSPDDDYDYEGLKQILTTRLRAIKGVRLKLTYLKTTVEADRARIEVKQDGSFLMGDRWVPVQDTHIIELQRDGKRWLISAGM